MSAETTTMHHPDCDINDPNIEGIRKPCNCGAATLVEGVSESRPTAARCAVTTGSVAVCWTDTELAGFAVTKCEDIFEQMTEADAMDAPWWIRQAWNVGKAIRLKRQNDQGQTRSAQNTNHE